MPGIEADTFTGRPGSLLTFNTKMEDARQPAQKVALSFSGKWSSTRPITVIVTFDRHVRPWLFCVVAGHYLGPHQQLPYKASYQK